jgi:Fur family zinc uptake transcriptional regulator
MPKSAPHDHTVCIATASSAAEQLAAQRHIKLTPLRRQVLTLICQSHKPAGAYQLLAALRDQGAEQAAPPTVYRALEFLVEHGLAHRIDSLNAFVACFSPGGAHHSVFLLCQACSDVREMVNPDATAQLFDAARAQGFTPTRPVLEIHGLCPDCTTHAKGSASP